MAKRYWLLKSEESCFGLNHLAAEPDKTTHWDGVRNYQARNLLRDEIEKGDTVKIDFENGIVIHEGNEYHFPALPPEVLAILEDGGLIPHVRKELGKNSAD